MNQTIYNISEICASKGMKKMVLSPGSRNAPLTISFARNPKIETFNIVDERSAGFIALGMALKSKEAVAICCTSGSALLNYAPAVAEAYYQQVPLIIFAADRPPEWIDQRDGQTINQTDALANFTKGFFQLPIDLSHEDAQWEFNRKINEAINLALSAPFGPVHINVPFREPFYPRDKETLTFEDVRVIHQPPSKQTFDYSELAEKWHNFTKKLIVVGQSDDETLNRALSKLKNTPIVTDVISNCRTVGNILTHDLFLASANVAQLESLKPDLLITTGKSLISKNLKLFLRKNKPSEHWHFENTTQLSDTFKTLTHHFRMPVEGLFEEINNRSVKDDFRFQLELNYKQNWLTLEKRTKEALTKEVESQSFADTKAYYLVCQQLKSNMDFHLANSMAVRYVNFFQFELGAAKVFANRGTSGIDSSNGTAAGNAIIGDKPVVLLTGDLGFFYDRNAFFHPYDLSKLKIIVFNNGGGGIFRLIQGPAGLPELEQHFETRHSHSAKFTAVEYGFDYLTAKDESSLKLSLELVFKDNKTPKLLEIFTDPKTNDQNFNLLKKAITDVFISK